MCFFPKKSRFFAKGAIIIVFLLTFTTKQIILRVFLPVSIPFSRSPYVLSSKKIVGEGVNYIIVFALDNKAISSLWFSAGLLPFFPLVPLFCSLKQLWSSTIHHEQLIYWQTIPTLVIYYWNYTPILFVCELDMGDMVQSLHATSNGYDIFFNTP